MWDTINAFEEKSWSPNNKGLSSGFKGIDMALNGLQKGFHIIAGDSNIGKTSFISQMSWNVATQNDNVYVIDFSLDDPMDTKLSRVIAAGMKVLINAVQNPREHKKYPQMLQRRKAGLRQLRRMVSCYKAYDQNHGTDVEQIRETIKRHMVALAEAGENRRVCVFIDNFHDLTTTAPEAKGSDKNKYDYLAQYISDMANEFEIPVVCTAEFKKLNGFRRPGIDDIRETVKIKYEAKSIMLCYNEVSLKGESASVYFEKQGEDAKQPVYEVKFAKNKYSKFKGRVFFEGYPEMAFFNEADEDSTKRYNHAIYSNE
ncbi:Replicative DNA helicase [compost metagenome]